MNWQIRFDAMYSMRKKALKEEDELRKRLKEVDHEIKGLTYAINRLGTALRKQKCARNKEVNNGI